MGAMKCTTCMEGMCLKFTPVRGRRLLCHLSMFGPMAGTSGTHKESSYDLNGLQTCSRKTDYSPKLSNATMNG